MKFFDNIRIEKKYFYVFLAVHLIVWSCIGLIRTVLPTDALEGIYWGSFMDLGTPKHPPLFGWLAYFTYLPFKHDYAIYFISQLFITFGFIYVYKLAKCFLDENKAMLSVIMLEGCWAYSYITGYYGFNPDVIMLFILPVIAYYFYQCITRNKKSDWIILGIITGISFLNKYQTAMLIIPMFVWACIFKRDVFKNIFFYISVIIAFIIFLPHILWLIKYDFFPFLYFSGELTSRSWLNHITGPLIFTIMQIAVIAGVILIFTALKIKQKSQFNIDLNHEKKYIWFLLLLGLMPCLIHLIMGIVEGGTMRPRWGFEFWFMTGIMLFYFFPVNIDKKAFIFTLKSSYIVMLIIFLSLGTLLAVEKNYRSRYPVEHVFNGLKSFWAEKYNTPLEYLGGYIEWTLPLSIYGDTHTKALLDTYDYPDPWTDYEKMKKAGVLVIDRTPKKVIAQALNSVPYLNKNTIINPIEYKFDVKNALGQPREYTVYYYIIPPVNSD